MTRRAETDEVRPWHGDSASDNSLSEERAWVVWGISAPPERAAEPEEAERPGEPGNDLANRIAESQDPQWKEERADQRWTVIFTGDEDDVDNWVLEDESVHGYAPYLIQADNAGGEPAPLRGVLRSDVVRRRSTAPGWKS